MLRKWLAALALGVIATAAQAAEPRRTTLHSNPAADDNLRLYVFLDVASATIALDGAAAAPLEVQSVMFTRLAPGPHAATVTLSDGGTASLAFTLAPDGQIESKGRRWWCLTTGRRNGQLLVLQMDSARCKAIAEQGPD